MANNTGKKFGGRTKGTPNKDTKALRNCIEALLEAQWEQVLEDVNNLSPKERIDTVIRLLEYALPKLNRTELKQTSTVEEILAMTPVERRARIQELRSQIKDQ